jgi:type IV secretory pathway VirB2 component (pilin)
MLLKRRKWRQKIQYKYILILFFISQKAFAQDAPWESVLIAIIDILNGPTARALAILSVIGLGLVAWFGRITLARAGGVIIGLVLVFGASSIADLFIAEADSGGF